MQRMTSKSPILGILANGSALGPAAFESEAFYEQYYTVLERLYELENAVELGRVQLAPGRDCVHELKCWPEYFEALLVGTKTFELRFDDRGYQVGDLLRLREWDPNRCVYTGRVLEREVVYILTAVAGLQYGWCLLGLRELKTEIQKKEVIMHYCETCKHQGTPVCLECKTPDGCPDHWAARTEAPL